jgi:glycosyltransferase involved in cell wall biosynthesis
MTTSPHSVLIIVENLPVPFDRRVWQEARTLRQAGWTVSVICPKNANYTKSYECIEGIHVYRHPLPIQASGLAGFALEYGTALFWEFVLSVKVLFKHGFDVVHACNPPDLIFLIGGFYKYLLGKRFVFDHHDISPELYEAKFGKRGFMHKVLLWLERLTFRTADASIATNESFRRIAVARGGMSAERVWVVKSYPDLGRFHRVAADPALKRGRQHLLGYVGIMGKQDGVDLLVDAMAHIVHAKGRRDVGCAIIGNGPELEALKVRAMEKNVADYIEFTGFLTGQKLLTYLSTIDVGAIPDPPNVYNDKISMNKVFEYMSLGIPFVQFDVTEGRSEAGDACAIAPEATGASMGDTLLALVDDAGRRATMAASGAARAKAEFRWEEAARQLLAAYASTIPTAATSVVSKAEDAIP